MSDAIPLIDAAPLFSANPSVRARSDAQIRRAATESGFMVLVDLPEPARLDPARRDTLLQVFELPEASRRKLWRQRYESGNANRYRGLAPLLPAEEIAAENLDIGCDAVEPAGRGDPTDLLCEASAWPQESELPGWREEVARAYAGLEALGLACVASLERGLGLGPGTLGRAFAAGNSTLKLARHPVADELPEDVLPLLEVEHAGSERWLQLILPHCDSGCVTFVSQDREAGLEARGRDGEWIPVPAPENSLAVNFGQLLETWTGGVIRATQHRVIGTQRGRRSIPFFFEPAVAACIEPLPGRSKFEPFLYGDYVWDRMQQFPDYRHLRDRFTPR